MNPGQWTRLSDLFGELVAATAAERQSRLADAAIADELGPELARELEQMLADHVEGRPLALEEWLAQDPNPAPERIGPYRLERLLGEGGMGEVWLAERDEPGFRRQVALKRIRRGLESAELRRRFGIEREALARLSHRGIAQLFDGGIDAAGVPYLALEYVDGRPLTLAADERRLGLDERLALFEEVCEAVHYAHVHLVVHRDLKPSNILLTAGGEVRLLDFGIAKLLDPESAGFGGRGETRTALRLATPEYSSPEQLSGESVTTATDVYALGLLLFELLTGRRPFRDHESSLTELERAVSSVDPRRASEAVASARDGVAAAARRSSSAALARALRGDLDTIVATALRKEPERRYPSVERLAEDVARFRANRPIRARPESAAYRLRKFAGRHRVGVGAAAVIALLVGAFAVFAASQSAVVARERDAARAERDKARELSTFLTDLFGADPFAGDEELRDTTTLGEFLERSEASVRRELADRPELRAALLSRLARLHGNLGRLDRARALAEEALSVRRALTGDRRADVAESANNLATVLQDQGELAAAEALFREALALREELYPELHADVAESVNNLAIVLVERADPARAEETERLERRGLALRRELFGEDHLDTLQSRNNFAVFLTKRGRPEDLAEAEGHLRDVLEGRRRRLGEDHPTVANALNNLANLLDDLGREAEAIALFRQAIRAWTVTLGPEHPRVATGLYGLYAALADSGDLAGAEQALRASLAIDERRLPPGHPYLATDRLKLGELLLAAGRPTEAESELRWALAAFREAGESGGKEAALAQAALDDCLARLARQDDPGTGRPVEGKASS
jgi:serine/threonine protein kinase